MQSIDIQPTCGRATVYAGEYLLLDSDVSRGGRHQSNGAAAGDSG